MLFLLQQILSLTLELLFFDLPGCLRVGFRRHLLFLDGNIAAFVHFVCRCVFRVIGAFLILLALQPDRLELLNALHGASTT